MTQCRRTWYVALPIIVLLVGTSYAETMTTCAMPTTALGKTATLTCHFKENPREVKEKPEIIIQHYGVNADLPDDLLECLPFNNDYNCTVDRRFSFSNEISDTLQLVLRHASKELEGRYICQTVPFTMSEESICLFHLSASAGESGINDRWTAVIAALIFSLQMI